MKPTSNELVVQHNALIEARYSLNLQEKRLILWIISMLKPGEDDFSPMQISVKDLASKLNLNDKDFYDKIKIATGSLRSRKLDIYNEQEKRYIQTNWLNTVVYHLEEGIVELHISSYLKPYLLELKRNFTQLQLSQALSLSSVYSVRIYELLKQYQRLGKREISVDNLKYCLGIDDSEYKQFGHFKMRILDPATQEINFKTDLCVQMEFIKRSRKITGIRFLIQTSPNPELQPEELPADYETNPLFKKLHAYGFSLNKCLELLQNHASEHIQSILTEIDSQLQKGKDISNPSGWILSALKNNWELSPDLPAIHQQTETARQDKISQELSELRQQQQQQEQKRLFDGYQKTLVQERWMLLEPNQQEDLLEQILSSDFLRRSWDNSGMKSPVIISLLRPHLLSAQEQDINQWIRHQV